MYEVEWVPYDPRSCLGPILGRGRSPFWLPGDKLPQIGYLKGIRMGINAILKTSKLFQSQSHWHYIELLRWDMSPWTPRSCLGLILGRGWSPLWPPGVNFPKLVFTGDQLWNRSSLKVFKPVTKPATWQYNELLRWDMSPLTPNPGWAHFRVGVELHFGPKLINYP